MLIQMKKCCIAGLDHPKKGMVGVACGGSLVARFRAFASDKSGAVTIEFVVLCASLMGIGTLSAVTVQSGALTRAGIIGDRLEEAQSFVRIDDVPAILPEISIGEDTLPGTSLPGSPSEPTGGSETADLGQGATAGSSRSGGGLHVVVGSTTDPETCPALIDLQDENDSLECDEQADDA